MPLNSPLLKVSEVEYMKSLYEILEYSAGKYKEKIAYREPEGKDGERIFPLKVFFIRLTASVHL